MKKLLITTAIAAVTAFGVTAHAGAVQVTAQTETRAAAEASAHASVPAFLSSSFTGMSVYNLDAESDSASALRNRNADAATGQAHSRWTRSDTFSSDRNDWNSVGRIKDIVMTQDGAIHGVLVDVGGFLGLGVHTVLVSIDELFFVSDSDTTDELEDFFVVISMTREELEILPQWNDDLLRASFDARNGDARASATTQPRAQMTPAQTRAAESSAVAATARTDAAAEARADAAATRTARTAAETEARETRAAAQAETAAARTAAQAETTAARTEAARVTRQEADAARSRAVFADNYAMLGSEERTVDRLMNADVFDSAGNKVGSVKNVVIGGDDDVLSLLVDIGGFLGMGAHTVNLPIDDARIGWSQSNDSVRVQVDMTRAQLEAMPAHEA
ncbi:MAG: PRC-barrel domain-containing protein [Oceanicaulis sp.]|nr:PRC-barrel domain-containing protein [Oceanicaulis sp.]